MMTCQDFEQRLRTAVERRDREELDRLEHHAAACGTVACRTAWEEHSLLERAILQWRGRTPQAVLPDHRRDAVLAPVSTSRPVDSSRNEPPARGALFAPFATAAACLGLMIGAFALRDSFRSDVALTPEATDHLSRPDMTATETVATGSLNDSVPIERSLGDSCVHVVQGASHLATDLALLIVPGGRGETVEDADTPDWFDRLEQQIEPVRTGVRGKFDEWFGMPAT